MSISIQIPTALRSFTDGASEVVATASKVSEALQSLTEQHPSLQKHLFNEQGVIRSFVNVYLNEENIRHLEGVETPVKDGDTLMIVPSIAGGSYDVG